MYCYYQFFHFTLQAGRKAIVQQRVLKHFLSAPKMLCPLQELALSFYQTSLFDIVLIVMNNTPLGSFKHLFHSK